MSLNSALSWEQRKFSDLVQIERGGSPRPIDDFITDSPDGLNWVKIGDAPAQGNYITKTAEKIKPEGLSKTREVHPGDLILSNSMSFGKPYIMGIDGCIHDGWLLIRNTYKVFDLTFLCHLLGTPQMIIQYKSLAAGSTVNNLNKELVGNTVVTIPTIKEQRVLGQYLETLDNLITLHQRKYDKLTNVKKSMLGKMFPQNGSNVPEIRFKGFTEAWEQRKLSEIATMHARIGWQNLRTSEFLDNGDYMLITGTDFMDGAVNFDTCHYVERERYEQDKHIQIRNGSILITKDGTLGKVAYIQGLTMPATLNAGVFNVEIRDEKEVDNRYLFQYLKAPFLMDYVDKKATGGTIKHLNQNILVDFPVVLPQKDEQAKIGEYFLGIDNLITLHQRKCQIDGCRFQSPLAITWEQRKLGEIGSVSMCRRIFKEQTSENGEIPFYKIGTFGGEADAFISRELFEEYKAKYQYPKKGDILISASGSIGRTVVFTGKNEYFQDSNIVWLNHDKHLDNSFLKCFYSIVKWAGIEGSTIKRLYNDNILNTAITLPSVEEQQKIGAYFENLDNLITLHQRKPNFYTGGYYAE